MTFEENQQRLAAKFGERIGALAPDRKSTRLNSSHGYISYAVFCLKKKKNLPDVTVTPSKSRRVHKQTIVDGLRNIAIPGSILYKQLTLVNNAVYLTRQDDTNHTPR